MKKLLTGILAVILIAAIWYFLRDKTVPAPTTSSGNLNELLEGARINTIDLTDTGTDSLFIPVENIINPEIEAAEMLDSFSSTQAVYFSGHVIVMEFLTNNIAAYTPEGDFVQKIGGGEISQAASVTANSTRLYIYDYGNKVIHSYNGDFNYRESVPFSAPYYTQGSLKMNETHLAYQREEASGFRVGDSGLNELLTVAEIDQPEAPVEELIPRIVPSGKHPGGFNNLLFSINSRSDIVSAYPALPYLFVYRNFRQHRNLVLVSSTYEDVDNPDLTPFQPVMGEAVRISNLMDQLYLMENGDILLFSFGRLHHLKLRQSGDYEYGNGYRLVLGDTGIPVESISSIDGSQEQPGTYYIISSGKLLILKLP